MLGAVKQSLGQGRSQCQPPLQVFPDPAFPLLGTAVSPPEPGGEAGLVGPSWDHPSSQPEQGLMTTACPWGNASGEKHSPCMSSGSPRHPSHWLLSHQSPGDACKELGSLPTQTILRSYHSKQPVWLSHSPVEEDKHNEDWGGLEIGSPHTSGSPLASLMTMCSAGLCRAAPGVHCHPGTHAEHRDRLLGDGVAGGGAPHRHDNQAPGAQRGMVVPPHTQAQHTQQRVGRGNNISKGLCETK